jgi:hemoglobin
MKNFHERIGDERLKSLISEFYSNVFSSPIISHLFQNDRDLIQEKQYKFLTQFLGGEDLYSREYGHPKMRMRHLPHRIDEEAKNEWLKCMRNAIDKVFESDPELGDSLYSVFPPIAEHMKNA